MNVVLFSVCSQAALVHTSESIRVRFFLDLLMEQRHPVMLVGNAGVGKTVLVCDKLSSLSENYAVANVPFNFYTTSGNILYNLQQKFLYTSGRSQRILNSI
jgi:dynein heavy chain